MKNYPSSPYLFVCFSAVLLLFTACDSSDPDADQQDDPPMPLVIDPTLSSIQTNIFTTTCATSQCHDSSNPARNLDLSAGQTFGETVNVASIDLPDLLLIAPGKPDSSYLVWKIEGNANIEGQRMPRGTGASPLSTTNINVIRTWITDGALDN
ncbi:MAG: hypothetical protein AAF564_15430 [Bacteroidota bacterium]